MKVCIVYTLMCLLVVSGSFGAPVDDDTGAYHSDQAYKPEPYDFTYTVNDPPSKNYYGHEEKGTEAGRTEGKYFVWLPDGRLMTVNYYVDAKSGYVPKITFSDGNYNPFQ